MDHMTFMSEREDLHKHCTDTLEEKAGDYAKYTNDRLNQFKRAACLENKSSAEALCGMMVKHETSIHDMAAAITSGNHYDKKKWLEKIGDLRNYCDLLWGLLIDEGEI